MPEIRRTQIIEGQPDKVDTFHLPFLNSRMVGPGVSNKVIYDLKKRGRSEIEFGGGTMIFEVVGETNDRQQAEAKSGAAADGVDEARSRSN